jgi:hypothetical protein
MNHFAEEIYFMRQRQAAINRQVPHWWHTEALLRARQAANGRRASSSQPWLRLLALVFKLNL